MEEHHHIKPNCKLCFAMWKNGKEEGITRALETIDDLKKKYPGVWLTKTQEELKRLISEEVRT